MYIIKYAYTFFVLNTYYTDQIQRFRQTFQSGLAILIHSKMKRTYSKITLNSNLYKNENKCYYNDKFRTERERVTIMS